MKISVIASGSNGNSCLVEAKENTFLIDAGKSMKEIASRVEQAGSSLEHVDGILLTHSHSDHTRGIGPIARKFGIPLYTTKNVHATLKDNLNKVDVQFIDENSSFSLGKTSVRTIPTSHDVPSTGFVIENFGLFTDTGIVTPEMEAIFPKLKGVLLESNHDIDMLLNGPYPYFLKQRILADTGHLSNPVASNFISSQGKHLDWVLLGHLSGNNNTESKVKENFESLVKSKMNYHVLSRERYSGTWDL